MGRTDWDKDKVRMRACDRSRYLHEESIVQRISEFVIRLVLVIKENDLEPVGKICQNEE